MHYAPAGRHAGADGDVLGISDLDALHAVALLLFPGAASSGPSLVVVAHNALAGGRGAGAACALGHGLGFGLYALLAVLGLSTPMRAAPEFFQAMQLVGAVLLPLPKCRPEPR